MIDRNMNARNFGLYSRDINKAAKNALRDRGGSYATIADNAKRFSLFAKWLNETHKIIDLRHIDKLHVEKYATHLRELINNDKLANATAHNRVSAINTVMEQARLNKDTWISSSDYFENRTGIRTENRAVTEEQYVQTHERMLSLKHAENLRAIHGLIRQLGLRPKESALINAQKALKMAIELKKIIIEYGSKGGQKRTIHITNQSQIQALRVAAKAQQNNRSLIPKNMNWAQWERYSYKAIRSCGEKGWYAGRNNYAIEQYQKYTGVLPPISLNMPHGKTHILHIAKELGITYKEARILDQNARLNVMKKLGHHRFQISAAYLG